jgi:xanthine dehydrogenase accessory factor
LKIAFLEQLLAARRERTPIAVLTALKTGAQKWVTDERCAGELELSEDELRLARQAILDDRSQLLERPGGELYIEVWNVPVRLVIVGAVHIAQSLVPIARLMGFEIVVVDPRSRFASEARFPATCLVVEWPESAIPSLGLDRRTAVVALTHNPRIDDPALMAALRSAAFYIGALGSRRTHEQRRERLAGEGFDAAAQSRIHAPIGLAIGASSPGEIAVAIAAEIVAVLRHSAAGVGK